MTTVQKPSYNPEMYRQEALIRAYMHLQPDWQDRNDIPRSRVVHFALDHWLNDSQPVDTQLLKDWYTTITDRDTRAEGKLPTAVIYFSAELHEKSQRLGAVIEGSGASIKKVKSTGGDYNRRLIIAMAYERLARIIHQEHPDLQPEE